MSYDPKKHHRRSIRLKNHDYTSPSLYYITLCCYQRQHFFGEVKDGKMILNKFGKIAKQQWENTENIRPQVKLHEYIFMPDHFHAIIEFKNDEDASNTPEKGTNVSNTSENRRGVSNTSETNRKKGEFDSPQRSPQRGDEKREFKSPSQSLGSVIRGFKSVTTSLIRKEIEKENSRRGVSNTPNNGKGVSNTPGNRRGVSNTPKNDSKMGEFDSPQRSPQRGTGNGRWGVSNTPHRGEISVWRRDYFEKIIRNQKAFKNITKYIRDNPKKWNK